MEKIIRALNTSAGRKVIVVILVAAATAFGVTISPDLADAFASVALAVAQAL